MAVYTHVDHQKIEDLLASYDIGALVSLKGIAEGVENSNFLLDTDQGRYILTVYEKRMRSEDLPFFLGLKSYLSNKGFPCPVPIADRENVVIHTLLDKPAAIVSFLPGKGVRRIHNYHVGALGAAMAELHIAGNDFSGSRANDLGLASWKQMFDRFADGMERYKPGLADQVHEHLVFLESHWPERLPAGIIHADLFPDNVFFQGEALTGVIDFYFACTDMYIYDLAVCLNAWCFEHHNEFNITKAKLLLSRYHKIRPLQSAEIDALPVVATGAAMRFFLTRMHDWLHQVEGALVVPKDPMEYWERLCFHKGLTKASAYGI